MIARRAESPSSPLHAGALESDDPKDALEGFANVIKMETEKGEWCAGVSRALRCKVMFAEGDSSRRSKEIACSSSSSAFVVLRRGFKALKQMVKLHFKLGNHKDMMERYRQMLTYVKSAVTRNYSEKARGGPTADATGSRPRPCPPRHLPYLLHQI